MTHKTSAQDSSRLPDNGTRRISSVELLAGAEQLVIEHRGADYRLRVTRQGKLILTK